MRWAGDGVTHARNTFPKFHPGVLGNVSVPFAHHPLGIDTVLYLYFLPQYKRKVLGVQYPENATVVVHVQNQFAGKTVNKKK